MIGLGILGSTRGSSMLPIINAIQKNQLSAKINIIISNQHDAFILEQGMKHHIDVKFVDPKNKTREMYDQEVSNLLSQHQVELVVLIGYMRILSNQFVAQWNNKVINVHPSLLPAFAGGIDLDVHRAVLASGIKETGCTVHKVTTEVDGGPIVVQKACPVMVNDTIKTLKARVQALEGKALVEAINAFSVNNSNFI